MSTLPALPTATVDDVGAILRARTKDLDGVEIGTFNANTRPTDVEVQRLIDMAYAEVTGRCGLYIGDPCASSGTQLVALRAAMWVEISYWPEQVRSDRSVYRELSDLWDRGIVALAECVAGNLPGVGDGGTTNAGFRFGVLDVHGWTASPYYGVPPEPDDPPVY